MGPPQMSPFSGALGTGRHGFLTGHKSLLYLVAILLLWISPSHALPGVVGVTYRHENDPSYPDPIAVARTLHHMRVPRVRLINPRPFVLAAFVGTGIELNLGIEERDIISMLASNISATTAWVQDFIRGPPPPAVRANVTSVTIGYDVLLRDPTLWDSVLAALANVRAACDRLPLPFRVPVSSASSFDVVGGALWPSEFAFKPELLGRMKTLLDFLNATGAPFQVDVFPYMFFHSHGKQAAEEGLSLAFATMSDKDDDDKGFIDQATGMRYENFFDIMVDAVVTALGKAGYEEMPVEVVGTGWPSSVEDRLYDPDASLLNAAEYNERLIARLRRDPGTPLRPYETPVTYIHSLFDAKFNAGDKGQIKDHMGIMGKDMEFKYNIAFVVDDNGAVTTGAGCRIATLAMFLLFFFIL